MKPSGDIASEILEQVSDLLNYELLVSTPGIKEPDSNFMWAEKFRAPVGINVIQNDVSFNLFLPEGSENEKDKKLFFSRVGAKLESGLWQVRREMSELSEDYASTIKLALGQFGSVILDYSYIQEGRYYAHFTFNDSDLAGISSTLIALNDVLQGYRIEYLRTIKHHASIFNGIEEIGEVATVSVDISREGGSGGGFDGYFPFVMANFLNGGVKTLGKGMGKTPPDILGPSDVSRVRGDIISFKSKNDHITELVKLVASNFIVLYGMYGVANGDSLRLMMPIPKQQTSILLKVLHTLINQRPGWNIKLSELSQFGEKR